jgi:outer membrane protein assembly factor BamD (BamD/ComL family)
MLKSVLAAAAAVCFAAACSQGPNEEAGEAADTAYEQSTTGQTELGQGPMEEAGEQLDAQQGATPPAGEATTTQPPATTPPTP